MGLYQPTFSCFYTGCDSYYSGNLWTGDTYTVHNPVSLPEGAVVKFAQLYNYWTWSAKGSTSRYPDMKQTLDRDKLDPDRKYSDRKGWEIYDYPACTQSYDVTDHITKSGSFTAVVENTGPDGSFFCMNGVGLLVVYTDEQGKYIEYWINEGCDMLNSGLEDDGTSTYTITDQTITEMMNLTISQGPVKKTTLWTIIQSGICDATPYPDLDIYMRDITGHPGQSAEEASPSKSIPGFKVIPAIALIRIISLLTFRKCKKKDQDD